MTRARRGDENEFVKQWYEENGEGLEGGWDAAHRDKELDADGVAGEVIFPDADAVRGGASAPFGAGLGIGGESDGELLMAGARAHNRWLAELCSDSPDRRCGLAIAPILHDIDAAVAEIRRAHESGLRGVLIPALWRPFPAYNNERYNPVWEVCEELQMPIHTHTGPAPREDMADDTGIYTTETIWWTARPMWFLLWSGVFERYPGLRFAVTEGGCWWLADFLWKWDTAYTREHATKKMGDIAPEAHDAAQRVHRPQREDRLLQHAPARDRAALRDRCGEHHVGERLPAPGRHVAAHEGVVPRDVLGLPGRGHPAHSRFERGASSTTSTSTGSRRSWSGSARRPRSSDRSMST